MVGLNCNSHGVGDRGFAAFSAGALVNGDNLDACLDQLGDVTRVATVVAAPVDPARPIHIDAVTRAQEARHATGHINADGKRTAAAFQLRGEANVGTGLGHFHGHDGFVFFHGTQHDPHVIAVFRE